jgi:hypothetical protein
VAENVNDVIVGAWLAGGGEGGGDEVGGFELLPEPPPPQDTSKTLIPTARLRMSLVLVRAAPAAAASSMPGRAEVNQGAISRLPSYGWSGFLMSR